MGRYKLKYIFKFKILFNYKIKIKKFFYVKVAIVGRKKLGNQNKPSTEKFHSVSLITIV